MLGRSSHTYFDYGLLRLPDRGGGTIGRAFASQAEGREFESWPRQTSDVNTGSDCSFAKCSALRSGNHGSFGYDLKNGGPVSRQALARKRTLTAKSHKC